LTVGNNDEEYDEDHDLEDKESEQDPEDDSQKLNFGTSVPNTLVYTPSPPPFSPDSEAQESMVY